MIGKGTKYEKKKYFLLLVPKQWRNTLLNESTSKQSKWLFYISQIVNPNNVFVLVLKSSDESMLRLMKKKKPKLLGLLSKCLICLHMVVCTGPAPNPRGFWLFVARRILLKYIYLLYSLWFKMIYVFTVYCKMVSVFIVYCIDYRLLVFWTELYLAI